jgi:hypothetical protein
LALKDQDTSASGKSRSTDSASECLPQDGQIYHENIDGKMYRSPLSPSLRNWQKDKPLICSAAASPAKTSQSPGSVRDSPGNAPACSTRSSASRRSSVRRGAYSRMFQGSLALTEAGTWPRFSKDFGNAGLWSDTGCWTAVISESPNVAVECSLSAVLQSKVSARYSLSAKAAAGILRRAEKRGRELPTGLYRALLAVSGGETTPEQTREPR